MARLRFLFLLILLYLTSGAALEVFAPTSHKAQMGLGVILPCTFIMNNPTVTLQYLTITWQFDKIEIVRFSTKRMNSDKRRFINVQDISKGIADLHIQNVTISDSGTYKCTITYSPEAQSKDVKLTVYAPPVISYLENKQKRFVCSVGVFYPRDINVELLKDGKVIEGSVMSNHHMNSDGTFSTKSTVIIPSNEKPQVLSCRVRHESLTADLQQNLLLEYNDEVSTVGIIVGCIIGILLISAAVIGIFWWKQKHRIKARGRFTIKDIEGPSKLFHGEETTLYCTATNCPEDICVTWLERRAGEVHEIQQSQPVDIEEEEKLLDTSYIIRSQRDGHLYSSSLRFIPYMETHRDVTFICRYVSGQRSIEKKFYCKTIYVKPQPLQPISQSLFVSGNLKYLMFLERFYPKSINITWTCGVGESQDIISSTETFTENPDGTFNVSSEVRMSEDLLKDPGFRVQVSWEHESLDKPGHKELSIRDPEYLWNPVVEELETPKLFYNIPVALQCNISEYFPDAVTVKWLRRKDQEICEESDTMSTTNIQSHRNTDNTYSCTFKLIITPTVRSHQGAEYICRVEHSSLERPIERNTGELYVIAKPLMMEPIKITVADSSRVQFSLNLQTFWPKDINIEWQNKYKLNIFRMSPNQTFAVRDDCTYDVTSVCTIPTSVFTDPENKVHVTWKHETMDEPEYRSLSIRDLCWCLQVGDINIPKLEDNKPVILTCNISGYFPDYLTVTWFKKKDGNMTELPITTDNTYMDSYDRKWQKDHNFSLGACLLFTPSIRSDQGSEFICRVKHPSLENPLERSTGTIDIGLYRNEAPEITESEILSSYQPYVETSSFMDEWEITLDELEEITENITV